MDQDKLDRIVAEARRAREERLSGYRAKALSMYPWICGRCAREFTRANVHELTVHHRDHDHSNNPEDGSNWELLCLYCHDNEHQRFAHLVRGEDAPEPAAPRERASVATHQPFAGLRRLLGEEGGGGEGS